MRIKLKAPYAPLLDGLSQVYLGMASPAALAKWGDQYQLHQVGTGPFRFVSYQERQSLVLEKNPDYNWAPAIRRHQGPAYLDRIEFRFYADEATRLPALLSGAGRRDGRAAHDRCAAGFERRERVPVQALPRRGAGQCRCSSSMNTALRAARRRAGAPGAAVPDRPGQRWSRRSSASGRRSRAGRWPR